MKIKLYDNDETYLPVYKTVGAAGADLHSRGNHIISSGEKLRIPTGIFVEIPEGYEIQIRPRSGLAFKGISLLNSPGTIDSDYRGEISVVLENTTSDNYQIFNGDRIAQMVYAPVEKATFEIVEKLSETDRGNGGYGSTGISDDHKINTRLEG